MDDLIMAFALLIELLWLNYNGWAAFAFIIFCFGARALWMSREAKRLRREKILQALAGDSKKDPRMSEDYNYIVQALNLGKTVQLHKESEAFKKLFP